jgi:plasmid stabilization system protein ParE
MRPFEVRMTADAVRDLEEIVDWIARHDGPERAQHVLDRIRAAVDALKRFPERGAHPAELAALGIREYRETFFKPYRSSTTWTALVDSSRLSPTAGATCNRCWRAACSPDRSGCRGASARLGLRIRARKSCSVPSGVGGVVKRLLN